jgi:hypothetical protein
VTYYGQACTLIEVVPACCLSSVVVTLLDDSVRLE